MATKPPPPGCLFPVAIALFVIGVGSFIGAASISAETLWFLARAERVIAVVVENPGIQRTYPDGGFYTSYTPTFEFNDPAGRTHTVTVQNHESEMWDFAVGEQIEVVYNPTDITTARPAGVQGPWFGAIILAMNGLVCGTLGVVLWLPFRRSKPRRR